MKNLIILNEPAYGNERSYNGLRLALSLAKAEGQELRVFLMGDSVTCARINQKTPDGYYNLERMLKGLAPKGVAGRRVRHLPRRPRHDRGPARRARPPLDPRRADRVDDLGRQGHHVLMQATRGLDDGVSLVVPLASPPLAPHTNVRLLLTARLVSRVDSLLLAVLRRGPGARRQVRP